MKKTLLIFCSFLSLPSLFAQEPADALRYAWTTPGGTARQQAIGGAMGSLGGDLSATFVNPAGLAFYKTGDLVLSPYFRFGKNNATYLDRTEKDRRSNFTLGTSGFVIGGGNNNNRNVALSLAYNRSADFNSNLLYRGATNQSSFSQKFLEELNNDGVKDGNLAAGGYPHGASLAFNSFWIDTVGGSTNGNFQFQSRSANLLTTGLLQENSIQTRGGINEFALGLAVGLNDKFMIGGTFGLPVLNYERDASFTEADATDDPNNKFNYATFSEYLNTSGVGINAKLGIIYKPVEYVRLGLAFHTPTVYNLIDRYEESITTDTEGANGVWTDQSRDYTGGAQAESKYLHITPYRAIASASYVIREIEDVTRQRGFITADVEFVNYKASSFSVDETSTITGKDYYKSLNDAIDKAYKSAFNFRVGGELKFTTLMVRAGAALFGNPYKNIAGEKGSRLNLSGGLGYRNKGKFVDVTYVHAMNKDIHAPYRLQNSPYSLANVKSTTGNVLVTFGVKF